MEKETEVVIIGAGLSGLSAALLLHEKCIDCVVLEARDRVGGRTLTKRDPSYGWVDFGASYVGPTQNRILRLAKCLGVETYKIPADGTLLHGHNGRPIRYNDGWATWNPLIWLDVVHVFREIHTLCREVPIDAPWTAKRAVEWDNMTVQQWLDKVCWFKWTEVWCRQFVVSNCTAEAEEVSFLWLLWYVASADGVLRIWEIDNSAQERKFIGGSQQISKKIANKLNERVLLEKVARTLRQNENGVVVQSDDGTLIKAKYAIMAIPPNLQQSVICEPGLPSDRIHLLQRLPMGACIKAEMWFKTPFWREQGLSGLSDSYSEDVMIGNTIDDTHHDGSNPALVMFIMGTRAIEAAKLEKKDRSRRALQCAEQIFGEKARKEFIMYDDYNWIEEPFTRGCYTCWGGPGVLTKYKGALRQPHGRLYFAGSETAVGWPGYMDGAVQAGERAAREVMCHMGLVTSTEIWVKEPEFSDIPAEVLEYSFMERHSPTVTQTLSVLSLGFVTACIFLVKNQGKSLRTFFSL